jgi:hypothetical protein
MKETLTLLERCQRDIWDNRLKKHDGTKIVISLSQEELTEAIANTLKQAAEAFIQIAKDARDEHNVARHGDSFYDAYDRVIDALTDAQKVLLGEYNENV